MSENLQDVPTGEFRDDSYVSRPGAKAEPLPVQSDAGMPLTHSTSIALIMSMY